MGNTNQKGNELRSQPPRLRRDVVCDTEGEDESEDDVEAIDKAI